MAGTDPKKQLLTLIRDFASAKSQGERRVVGLKRRFEELQSELQAANEEREEAKQFKETTEQELTGYEVELALNDTAVQALESRIYLIQNEISTVGAELDGFIFQMYELNATISTLKALEDVLADVVSQKATEEEQYQEQEKLQKQIQLELIDIERKVSLMEMIMEETRSLQDLTRYPCSSYKNLMIMS